MKKFILLLIIPLFSISQNKTNSFQELDENFRPDSSFTGIGYSLYENGQIEFMAKFTNGDYKIGTSFYLEFSETGQVEYEEYFIDSQFSIRKGIKRNGPGKGMRWEYQYKDGKIYKYFLWHKNGILAQDILYDDNGKPWSGNCWDEDGKPFAYTDDTGCE